MLELPLDDWRLILSTRANVLIEGPEAATAEVLRVLTPLCRAPMADWGQALGDARPPTLIVREVWMLPATEQHRLLRWLDIGERAQVLSTTSQPLFALVERRQFLESLFYRLNVIRLDAAPSRPHET
jgi:hypothetical protein